MNFITEFDKAKIELDKINSKMENLNKQIEGITKGEPSKAKHLLDEVVTKLEKTRININQVNVDIKSSKRFVILLFYL